ncbi:3-hydroxyacyl-CoA dehydrogenase NAD-binding domain-containing protein [Candidatus Pseudothioglobus sp. Uisw_041]|uniref:3-hydroxyacyl-CoA dehydrogenase/enoyl-CoA hydratase family protein n=1 Tax=Candidatus Pseudothioglobus sp. Uisw_041 TaxID=3230996 RepID=UPI003A894C62
MTNQIKKVGVIGAGTMGAGIAGQVANAGVEVWLLDLPSEGENVNSLAAKGLERLKDPDMPGLMSKEAESLIRIGNTRDHFHELEDCDWIAEAVVERLDIKQALYQKLNEGCKESTIITSNTSTIPISLLTKGMPKKFCERFAITHFFNPVRFMRLLELVRGEFTRDEVIDTLDLFSEKILGKGVVSCSDTPGFLANRVGVFAIQCALHKAFEYKLSPTEADAFFGRPLGLPKTGVFGLYDLIGIDLMADVVKSLVSILPENDAFHKYSSQIKFMSKMIANGQTGNKNEKGFYKQIGDERQVIDLSNGSYGPHERLKTPLLKEAEKIGVSFIIKDTSPYGLYIWDVISETLCYAASLVPEVTDDLTQIDDAMKLGYNWVQGPFELLDEIGIEYFVDRLQADGRDVPEFLLKAINNKFYINSKSGLSSLSPSGNLKPIIRPDGVLRFSEVRQTLKAINSNESASWFEYEGAAIVEFHSKANALDSGSLDMISDAISESEKKGLRGVVIHNDFQHFSCGVSLWSVRNCFEKNDFDALDAFLIYFQNTMLQMRNSKLPVIAAPVGMSIGGGFEVVLHADHVVGHANSVMGLVESFMGVVPAGGGCKETLYRWSESLGDGRKGAWKSFMNIGLGRKANSPQEADALSMRRANDVFHMNRDRILTDALSSIETTSKAKARNPLALSGVDHFEEMLQWLTTNHKNGMLTPHDVTVGTEIGRIMTGGNCASGTIFTEQDILDAERSSFLTLAQTQETQARIVSMLDNGITLRN